MKSMEVSNCIVRSDDLVVERPISASTMKSVAAAGGGRVFIAPRAKIETRANVGHLDRVSPRFLMALSPVGRLSVHVLSPTLWYPPTPWRKALAESHSHLCPGLRSLLIFLAC